MAKRKRKTSGRSTASRRKNRTQDRMPAGLITLFAGLVLMALAFVPGSSAWRTMHDVLFGVFGCGSFVLGAALCYLAILYTRGEDLLPHIAKLALGLIFASGTVIVFSDIPADIPAARMVAECYQNGVTAWLGGGALGALLGGNLLLLDEPTNHLDMESISALNDGLKSYPGVIIFASRDHQVVETTANRIFEIIDGKLIDKMTTYDEYLASDEDIKKRFVFTLSGSDASDN